MPLKNGEISTVTLINKDSMLFAVVLTLII